MLPCRFVAVGDDLERRRSSRSPKTSCARWAGVFEVLKTSATLACVQTVTVLFQCQDHGRGDGGVQAVGAEGEDNADVLRGGPMG